MRQVTFYGVTQKLVSAYSAYVPVYHSPGPLVSCLNSPDVFSKAEIEIDHIPVKQFFFTRENGTVEERFIALDRELESILGVMIDDETRSIRAAYKKSHSELTQAYESHIKDLESRTAWDILKLNLAKWWK